MSALEGWRVLVPRGGRWGIDLADRLRAAGGSALIAPLIAFEPAEDEAALAVAVARLAAGDYDWLVLTSATTVEALERIGARIPARTRVAVVGEHTAEAAREAGFPVDFVPDGDHAAQGLVTQWPAPVAEPAPRVLLPQSQLADETLLESLGDIGLDVERITAYRTVAVPPAEGVAAQVAAGGFDAIVLTAGSVAARVADEFPGLPEATSLVAIGPRTAAEAEAAGLPIAAVAPGRSAAAIVEVLALLAERRRA